MPTQTANTRTRLYWNTLLNIPVKLVVFVISIIVTRLLDPADFGIMTIVMMIIGYSNLITNFGLNEAIIQKTIKSTETIYSIFTIDIAISLILMGAIYLSANSIAAFFNMGEISEVIRIMSLTFVITSFYALPIAILRRELNFRLVALFEAVRSMAMAVTTLTLAIYGFGYWSLVFGQLIPLTVVTLALCIKVKFVPKLSYDHERMKSIYHFGGWNLAKIQLQFFNSHIDRFLIGRWYDPASLGFYDKALTLSGALHDTVTININSVMFSTFSSIKKDREKLQQQLLKGLAIVAYASFPMYLGLLLVTPYFVPLILGEKWIPMIVPFQIVLIGFFFGSLNGLLASFNIGIGQYRALTLRLFYAAIFFTICCLLLLRFDIHGIAIAFALLNVLTAVLWMSLALRATTLTANDVISALAPALAAACTMFFLAFALRNIILNETTFLNLLLLITAGACIYLVYIALDPSPIIKNLRNHFTKDFKLFITPLFNRR